MKTHVNKKTAMSRQHRDDVIVIIVIFVVSGLAFLGSRYHSFRVFFAWPNGGTWSNTIAWLEDDALALFAVWYFRNNVGKRIARWWSQHRAEHMTKHIEEMQTHVSSEISQLVTWLRSELDDHHGKIISAVDDRISGVNYTSGSADGENAP